MKRALCVMLACLLAFLPCAALGEEEEIETIVTLLDAPLSAADAKTPDMLDLGVPCFDLEGYHLQITDLSEEMDIRWLHWRKKPE